MLTLMRLQKDLGEVPAEVASLVGNESGHGGLKGLGTRLESNNCFLWVNGKGWNGG